MQLLKEWPPNRSTPLGKRKRAGSRSIFDEDRGANGDGRKKSSVADDESRAKEGSAGVNDENTSLLSPSSLHAEIPSGRDALPSPPIQSDPNQSIHPAFHSGRVLPLSPLSRSPEHNSEQPLTGASHRKRNQQSFRLAARTYFLRT